jgi:adenine-specific DNA methylase
MVKFEIDGEQFIIEPATDEDMYIFERGKEEMEKGEYIEIENEEEL